MIVSTNDSFTMTERVSGKLLWLVTFSNWGVSGWQNAKLRVTMRYTQCFVLEQARRWRVERGQNNNAFWAAEIQREQGNCFVLIHCTTRSKIVLSSEQ